MEAIKNTLAENFGGIAQNAAAPENQFSLDECPSLQGKVAVITGGSEGIGYGASYTLLKHGVSKLFMLSRDKECVDKATDAIRNELGDEAASKVTWFYCDLSDWASVPKVADQIKSQTDKIHMLFNNAARGIMTYQLTDIGVDRHMYAFVFR